MRQRKGVGWLALLLILLFSVASWGDTPKDFVLERVLPQGEVRGFSQMSLLFSAPVVSSEMVGKKLAPSQAPALFSPPLQGRWIWQDPRHCVFNHNGSLQPATAYHLSLKADLRNVEGQLLGGAHDFQFHTPPLKVFGFTQRDFRPDGTVVGTLRFSLPVMPSFLEGYLSVEDESGKTVPVTISRGRPSREITLRIQLGQKAKGSYRVVVAKGLPPVVGDLGLSREARLSFSPKYVLAVTDSYANTSYEGTGRIWIGTTSRVNMARAKDFISLEPAKAFSLEPSDGGFWIEGPFVPRDRVVVTLKKGLPGKRACSLKQPFRKAFVFPDKEPSLRFAAGGTYLSPLGLLRVPLEGVNVENLEIQAWKMYENNIPLALGLETSWLNMALSRKVASENLHVEARRNEPFRKALDLTKLLSSDKGVFIVEARDKDGSMWDNPKIMVSLTDLGIIAKVSPRGIMLWVNSIHGATPVKGAAVKVYSRSNQLLATLNTDHHGVAELTREEPWEEALMPWVVTVGKGEDLSYLVLRYDLLQGREWELGGRPYLNKGYEAFVFTPRGIFRPGETVDVTGLVRDRNNLPPGEFPLTWVLRDSRGRKVHNESVMVTPKGFVSMEYPLSNAAPTGEYHVSLSVPQCEDKPLGNVTFLVEDFVPPRIKVAASADTAQASPEKVVHLALRGDYLFGAPGAGLTTEGEVRFVPTPFAPKGYNDYVFDSPEEKLSPYEDFLGNGNLDDQGQGAFEYIVPPRSTLPKPGDLLFRLGVAQEGGRMVWEVLRIPYHPCSEYPGIGPEQGDLEPGKTISFPVVVLKDDGTPSRASSLEVQFFKAVYHSVVVEEGGRYHFRYNRELLPMPPSRVALQKGQGTVTYTPKEYGEYLVKVTSDKDGSSAAREFYVWGGSGEEGAPLDTVSLRLDKTTCVPGDQVRLRCELPFEGNLLVTVETDRVVYRKYLENVKDVAELSLPVTKEMTPNAYCVVWLLRPQGKDNKHWHNPRALGVTRFKVDQSFLVGKADFTLPQRALPGKDLVVAARLRDAQGNPLEGEAVIALVDEGILGLTKFATPNPYGFFTALRALGVRGYDLYDSLMPPEEEATSLLSAAGGDGERSMAFAAKSLSPVQARRFKPVALFAGPLSTDAEGMVRATFDIPEFSGTLRAMVVGAGEKSFCSQAQEVLVAQDVVVETTLPRALAPGDTFTMPLTLFSKAKDYLGLEISVQTEGPLVYQGQKAFHLSLPPQSKGERISMELPLKVSDQAGIGTLRFSVKWNDQHMEQVTTIPVRPPYPLVRRSGGGAVPAGESACVDFGKEWFPGTFEGVFSCAGTPVGDITTALHYLDSYPYGCLEQTVSGVWPLVALPNLVKDLDPLLVNPEENKARVESALRRILAMQGYAGAFSFWPGSEGVSYFGTAYATHLLVEASQKGYAVPKESLKAALDWIQGFLSQSDSSEISGVGEDVYIAKTYGVYVLTLAGRTPLGWMEHFRERRGDLSQGARLFLAGAYALEGHRKEALSLLDTFSMPLEAPSEDGQGFGSGVRNTALALLVLVDLDPNSEQAALGAEKLLKASREGLWRNTQENAFAAVALGRYFQSTQSEEKSFEAVLRSSHGGEPFFTLHQGERKTLSMDNIEAFELTCKGKGRVFYSWSVQGVPQKAPVPMSQGIAVSRRYVRRDGKPWSEGEPLKQGELLEVELTLKSHRDLTHLVVADLLPGGLEIDNPRLQAALEGTKHYAPVREEIRDDRLLLFLPYLNKKETLVYTYRVRAVTAGTFILPPVAAEAMYDPSIQALGKTGTVTIEKP